MGCDALKSVTISLTYMRTVLLPSSWWKSKSSKRKTALTFLLAYCLLLFF
jgi:hypothetical protein